MLVDYKSYIFSGQKELCTGCGACVQVCSQKALTMEPDSDGFLYPKLDNSICVSCGACERTCPVVGDSKANEVVDRHCYVATTDKKKYYKESASIGVCTMLSEKIVNEGGIVYGVYLDEKTWSAYHTEVKDWKGIDSIRNSKYLQSDTKQTFSNVKKHLINNDTVLYIGTPCQIAGLKAFLKKEYQNLYTIDIICHGVFSPKLMPLEVNYWEQKFKGGITNFKFRSKRKYTHVNGGMVNFDVIKPFKRIVHVERHASSSPTYKAFAYSGDGISHNIRLSCYDCPFRSANRYGDVTVGDPWEIKDDKFKSDRLKSSNCVRSLFSGNTKRGNILLSTVLCNMEYQEMGYGESFIQDAVIPIKREQGKRDEIFRRIEKEDYGTVIQDIFKCDLEKSHRLFAENYYKKTFKRFIRRYLDVLIKWAK